MKKLSFCALLASATALAWADPPTSNVTLFGIVDLAVRHVDNGGGSTWSLGSSGLDKSRIGVRGFEDLGDGLKAGFWLESGFNADTGQQFDNSRFWNRRATLSLVSARLGELRLGRDFTPTYLAWSSYDVFGTNGVGSADKFVSTLGTQVDTLVRSDNQVSWFAPAGLHGFYGQLAAAPGEGVDGKKYHGGRLGYAAGPADVSVSYGQTTVAPNAAGDDKFKVASVAGSYDFGSFKLVGYWNEMKHAGLKLAVYDIGAAVPIGPGTVRVSYISANASGITPKGVDTDPNDAHQFAVGYVYDFSKRTALYATAARVENKGVAAFSVAAPPVQLPGGHSTGYEFGMRHKF